MTTTNKIVQNALKYAARNDKWIDDFHVIVTADKPDPALVEALKKKSAAWKVLKRNFSDKAADEAHTKAEDEALAIAKRLGAKWIQQGAVSKIVMPNADTSIVEEKAVNAQFKVGDIVGLKLMDGGRRDYVIYEVLPDSYRLCYADNFGVGCERVRKYPRDEFVDKHRRMDVPNSVAANAEYVIRKAFTPGKWILAKKATSLADDKEQKAFASEQEARDYAEKNGLKVSNAEACNAKFKVGDIIEWWGKRFKVLGLYPPNGAEMRINEIDSAGKLKPDADYVISVSDTHAKLANARNASSSPFGFFVGEQVVIKKDPSNKKYRVKEITETGDIRLEGATPLFDASELDTANYAGPYRATNAKFKAGDKAYVHWFSGEDELVDVISYEPKGDYYIVRGEDGQLTHPKASLLYPVKNSRAANAKFKVGDKVYFYGRPATVKQVIREPDADYILDVQGDEFYAEDEEVTSRNSRACNSKNAIVRKALNSAALNFFPGDKVSIIDTDIRYGGDKGEVVRKDGFRYVVRLTSRQDKPEVYFQPNQLKAANSEDAQGHEHGSDGKFVSKGGGSDGGDSYEDPKTKRMKERLAKMREKNEALRKDIEARKAGLAQKKADTEKMRAEVMKANVEKWKAGIPKTKNSIVAKALNSRIVNNFNYKNKYQFFCVDPSLGKPCILSGWDYKEDAQEDAQELKELKIPFKILSRKFLEQKGVDPNDGDWWKKSR